MVPRYQPQKLLLKVDFPLVKIQSPRHLSTILSTVSSVIEMVTIFLSATMLGGSLKLTRLAMACNPHPNWPSPVLLELEKSNPPRLPSALKTIPTTTTAMMNLPSSWKSPRVPISALPLNPSVMWFLPDHVILTLIRVAHTQWPLTLIRLYRLFQTKHLSALPTVLSSMQLIEAYSQCLSKQAPSLSPCAWSPWTTLVGCRTRWR